jgi:hypothetical protein
MLMMYTGEWVTMLEHKEKMKLVLNYKGRDSWERPVYECGGCLYVDVDPRKDWKPNICTKSGNSFDGEPDSHIAADVEVEFVPERDTW